MWWITSLIQVICNVGAASRPRLLPCLDALRAVPHDAFAEMPDERQVRPAPQPIIRYLETLHGFLDLEEPVPVVGGLRLRRHEPA